MKRRETETIHLPIDDETENGRFKHKLRFPTFRGQKLPESFVITYKGKREPKEGQVIGHSRMGQTLIWSQGSVIAKG